MSNYKFILSGGGTGGHIYPAIAIADGLKKQFPLATFLFVGAKGKMEMEKVPQAGYKIKGLYIAGLSRKLSWRLLTFPFKLLYSLLQSFFILLSVRPHLVIGTGGYASAPLLKMAQIIGYPTLVQEQNSYAGVANKWLAKKAKAICVAYPNMEQYFPKAKIVFTGNPVRIDLEAPKEKSAKALAHFGLQANKPVLLILGGSLGAKKINQFVAAHLSYFNENEVQLLWQCGRLYFHTYKQFETAEVKPLAFIDQMPMAYAAADIVLSRAGAGAVSESMLMGRPTIFIPSPNVAEDHQTKNALSISKMGAGVMIKETSLETDFKAVFESLLKEPKTRETMIAAMKKAAKPDATANIVNTIEGLIVKSKSQI